MVEILCLAGSLVALLACVLIALRCRKLENSAWDAASTAWTTFDRINHLASKSKGEAA